MIATESKPYTTKFQAGLGLIQETQILFDLWQPGWRAKELYNAVLESGQFPNVAARRLRNIVHECFSHRYLVQNDYPAVLLVQLKNLPTSIFVQFLFLYTCRVNDILHDFVTEVYWARYSGGYDRLTNDDATDFVYRAVQEGKTTTHWSDSTIRRVSSYLTGCCLDYGLLEKESRSNYRITAYRINEKVSVYLAHDLHFNGLGDNAVIAHADWLLFGLNPADVQSELKRLSLKGHLILQSAGDLSRISWKYQDMEELINVIA